MTRLTRANLYTSFALCFISILAGLFIGVVDRGLRRYGGVQVLPIKCLSIIFCKQVL